MSGAELKQPDKMSQPFHLELKQQKVSVMKQESKRMTRDMHELTVRRSQRSARSLKPSENSMPASDE